MKKIFFVYFFLFSFFLFSCSSGNSVRETSSKALSNSSLSAKPTSDDFRDLYEKMVKSPEYIDYSGEVDRFVSDMNYSGDSSIFKSKDDLLIWVDKNIGQTNFTDYNEAKGRYSIIQSTFEVVVENHSAYFSMFKDIEINDSLISIVSPPIAETGDCGCVSAFNSCNRGATKIYLDTVKAIEDSPYIPAGAPKTMALLTNEINYSINKAACSQSLALCKKGCN